jgi:bifunctional pyridoxal-dependent enzyme with beta-cystathionase and maltose regulon repressor activities
LKAFLVETCNVAPNWGETFARNCRTFARFNLATTPENVVAVAERIGDALQKLQK